MNKLIRRHHIKRLRNKRKWYWWNHDEHWNRIPLEGKRLGMVMSAPCIHSDWMSGNPRKFFKRKTRKEILSEFDERQQIKEFL